MDSHPNTANRNVVVKIETLQRKGNTDHRGYSIEGLFDKRSKICLQQSKKTLLYVCTASSRRVGKGRVLMLNAQNIVSHDHDHDHEHEVRELSDDELDMVAGGAIAITTCPCNRHGARPVPTPDN